jgi:hypothetical protein
MNDSAAALPTSSNPVARSGFYPPGTWSAGLTVSAGLAPDKFPAKLVSLQVKIIADLRWEPMYTT